MSETASAPYVSTGPRARAGRFSLSWKKGDEQMTIHTSGGKINASMSTLNLIAGYAAEAAQLLAKSGTPALAKQAEQIASEIHAALSGNDYYEF